MTLTIAKWTINEYHRMIAAGILDNRRVELLRGEIVEMSPEGEPRAYFSSEAAEYLIQLLGNRAMIRSSKPITLTNDSEPEPDIAIMQRLGREYLEHHPYPENIFWLVEPAKSHPVEVDYSSSQLSFSTYSSAHSISSLPRTKYSAIVAACCASKALRSATGRVRKARRALTCCSVASTIGESALLINPLFLLMDNV